MITEAQVRSQLKNCLLDAHFPRWAERFEYRRGKVRDMYLLPGKRIIITTDRQSAFDHHVGSVPHKGRMLNGIANWWFARTADIAPNHVIAVPHPNVVVADEARVIPLEIVMRRHITGSTSTSMWTHYERGVRCFCGVNLPDGLRKHQRLPFRNPVFTPSTKDKGRDVSISPQEAIRRGLVTRELWEEIKQLALPLFLRAEKLADAMGLTLFDTKYEMGFDQDGNIMVVDEIFTPDSSRWVEKATFLALLAQGKDPEMLDKEFVRLWLVEHGFTDQNPIQMDDNIRVEAALKWSKLYERITGASFDLETDSKPVKESIRQAIAPYFA